MDVVQKQRFAPARGFPPRCLRVCGLRLIALFRRKLLSTLQGRGRNRLHLVPARLGLDHVRAAFLVPVQFLAIHAVDAFVDIDFSIRMNGLDGAFVGA